MKAIILAAGRGTRLGRYTQSTPKGMLKIGGKTILEMQIDSYRNAGITDISIVVGYKGETINFSGVKYYWNNDFDNTNMVVSLMEAEPEFTNDIIISYADIIFHPQLLKRAIEANNDAVVFVDSDWEKYWNMRYGTTDHDLESLVFDKSKNIVEIGRPDVGKENMTSRYIGIIKFSKQRIQDVKKIANEASITYRDAPWKLSCKPYPKAYMTDLLQALVDAGIPVKAENVANGWLEFDTESDYENVQSWVSTGAINALFNDFNALINKNYQEEKRMQMVLIRHGESIDDILDCYGGAADYALSDSGKQTAEDVAKSLHEVAIDRIYSSPLKRAIQTAEAIDSEKRCGITTIANLRERNSYGVLSGCNKDDCKEIYGYLLAELNGKPGDYYSDELVLGAEPKSEFDQRVKEALLAVANDAQEKEYHSVAVVTHGNATRSIYKNVLNFDKKIDLDLLAKSVIEYNGTTFTLISKEGVYEK